MALSEAETEEFRRLVQQGLSVYRLSARYNRSIQWVRDKANSLGLKVKLQKEVRQGYGLIRKTFDKGEGAAP